MAIRLYDPNRVSPDVLANPGQGDDNAAFSALGVATVDDVSLFQRFLGLREPGLPGLQYFSVAGNIVTTIAVPTAKWWRVIGIATHLVTDASVGNRGVRIRTRNTAGTVQETFTHANVAASNVGTGQHVLFGVDDYVVGNLGVKAAGTFTLAVNPSNNDTHTMDDVVFTWKTTLTGAINELLIGANLAASKVTYINAFGATPVGTANDHSVSKAVWESIEMTAGAFTANDSVHTAVVKGTAGNSLATTETYTSGSNIFDAATLGTTTAGVDAAIKLSAKDWPEDLGANLPAAYDIVIDEPTVADTGDVLKIWVFYVEYDADPTLAAGIGYNS